MVADFKINNQNMKMLTKYENRCSNRSDGENWF